MTLLRRCVHSNSIHVGVRSITVDASEEALRSPLYTRGSRNLEIATRLPQPGGSGVFKSGLLSPLSS